MDSSTQAKEEALDDKLNLAKEKRAEYKYRYRMRPGAGIDGRLWYLEI